MNERAKMWVLYDDSCGFCRRWVPFWEPVLRRRGYHIAPLQAPWVRDRLRGLEGLTEDLRLLYADGSHVAGADVYRHVMRSIWWAYPIFMLSIVPGLRHIFDAGNRCFARNRIRFSKACGLPPATLTHKGPANQ